jgi:hypothetical protein
VTALAGILSPDQFWVWFHQLTLAQWLFRRLLLNFLSFSFFSSFLSSLVFSMQLDFTELRAFRPLR